MAEQNREIITEETNRLKKLIIIGFGGHGKVIADIAKKNGYSIVEYLDDDLSKVNDRNSNVIGTTHDIVKYINSGYDFFIGIGDNSIRQKYYDILHSKGITMPILIHPDSVIDNTVEIGEGTVIMANAVINAGTIIGRNCIINTSSSVDHDCKIEDFVHISPGVNIAGNVSIGNGSWICIGCSIINNITIYENVIIGAGTTVLNNISQSGKYVGLPLRRISE